MLEEVLFEILKIPGTALALFWQKDKDRRPDAADIFFWSVIFWCALALLGWGRWILVQKGWV